MSESKPNGIGRSLTEKFADREDRAKRTALRQRHSPALLDDGPRDQVKPGSHGWEAYRRWLSRVQSPAGSRVPLDTTLYTWKGYRNWADQIRREWKTED